MKDHCSLFQLHYAMTLHDCGLIDASYASCEIFFLIDSFSASWLPFCHFPFAMSAVWVVTGMIRRQFFLAELLQDKMLGRIPKMEIQNLERFRKQLSYQLDKTLNIG